MSDPAAHGIAFEDLPRRIAFVNWSNRSAGGAESYIAAVMAALAGRGHRVALLAELDAPADRPPIPLPRETPTWIAGSEFHEAARALQSWGPDVLFVHGLQQPGTEQSLIDIAPAALLAHNYYGTCISGQKTFVLPRIAACQRRFGPGCLWRYYPRRTGGLDPRTMWQLYRLQRQRNRLLGRYARILTLSEYMRREYARHGFEHTARRLPLPVPAACQAQQPRTPNQVPAADPGGPARLLFAGRMDQLKGGGVALDALPEIADGLRRPVEFALAGDGPRRAEWERRAATRLRGRSDIAVRFHGWQPQAEVSALMDAADVLVLPSLWPEPLGLVGLEAAFHALPVAAFASGGIPEWLSDGANGHLAPADPPTARGLANAVIACLATPTHHAELRAGASRLASTLDMTAHLAALERALSGVAAEGAS